MRRLLPGVALLLAVVPGAYAQAGWVDAYVAYHRVTDDFGDWRRAGLRLAAPKGAAVFFVEGFAQEAFNDKGVYGSAGFTLAAGSDWVFAGAIAGGTGDFVLPQFRIDGSIGRKWLASRRLVTTLGITYVDARLGFEDLAVSGSAAVYLGTVVLEAGGRWNWSDPGEILSRRGYVSVTHGKDGSAWVVLRGSTGTEAYQLLGIQQRIQEFTSSEGSIHWRQWIGRHWGSTMGVDVYDNPFYTRTGVTLGLFRSW